MGKRRELSGFGRIEDARMARAGSAESAILTENGRL
jgi:hypothetical protein